MAPLKDPELLAAYKNALANRGFHDYINWTGVALDWLARNIEGYTPQGIVELIYEYVQSGGEIDQVPEKRPEWIKHDFHYDFRFDVGGRRVYVETRLFCDDPSDPDDPTILIANVHDA